MVIVKRALLSVRVVPLTMCHTILLKAILEGVTRFLTSTATGTVLSMLLQVNPAFKGEAPVNVHPVT